MIFNIKESGKLAIDKMLNDCKQQSFRIYIRRVSNWLGPVFDIALDDATELDIVFKHDNYNIVINKELASKINSIEIFFEKGISKSGFRVLTDICWKFEYRFKDWAKNSTNIQIPII